MGTRSLRLSRDFFQVILRIIHFAFIVLPRSESIWTKSLISRNFVAYWGTMCKSLTCFVYKIIKMRLNEFHFTSFQLTPRKKCATECTAASQSPARGQSNRTDQSACILRVRRRSMCDFPCSICIPVRIRSSLMWMNRTRCGRWESIQREPFTSLPTAI